MKRLMLVVVTMWLVIPCAFAVDGVVLINQATVMAAGGFPYVISQPGSYRLSGNLTMNTSPGGNISGIDVAIGIGASNVALDLNGFSIVVNNPAGKDISHSFYAIAELGTFSQIAIRNGNISLRSTGISPSATGFGLYLASSSFIIVEGLNVSTTFVGGFSFFLGAHALVRNNVSVPHGLLHLDCPSLIVDNVGIIVGTLGEGCLGFDNSL